MKTQEFNRYKCTWEDDVDFCKHDVSHRAAIPGLPIGNV